MILTQTQATVVFPGDRATQILSFHNEGPADAYILIGRHPVTVNDYTIILKAGKGQIFEGHRGIASAMLAAGAASRVICITTTYDGKAENIAP